MTKEKDSEMNSNILFITSNNHNLPKIDNLYRLTRSRNLPEKINVIKGSLSNGKLFDEPDFYKRIKNWQSYKNIVFIYDGGSRNSITNLIVAISKHKKAIENKEMIRFKTSDLSADCFFLESEEWEILKKGNTVYHLNAMSPKQNIRIPDNNNFQYDKTMPTKELRKLNKNESYTLLKQQIVRPFINMIEKTIKDYSMSYTPLLPYRLHERVEIKNYSQSYYSAVTTLLQRCIEKTVNDNDYSLFISPISGDPFFDEEKLEMIHDYNFVFKIHEIVNIANVMFTNGIIDNNYISNLLPRKSEIYNFTLNEVPMIGSHLYYLYVNISEAEAAEIYFEIFKEIFKNSEKFKEKGSKFDIDEYLGGIIILLAIYYYTDINYYGKLAMVFLSFFLELDKNFVSIQGKSINSVIEHIKKRIKSNV